MAKDVKKGELSVSTMNELRKALASTLRDLRRYKGGNVLMVIEPRYAMDIELEAIRYFIDYEDLDGVVVTLTRPYFFVHKALTRHVKSPRRPYYVDPMTYISGTLTMDPNPKDTKVFSIDGPFEVERVYSAIEKAVNAIAKTYQGDEYFVFIDNLMGVGPYVDLKDTLTLSTRVSKGFKGSFVHKFICLTRSGGDYFNKVYKKAKSKSDIVLYME